MAKRKRKTYGKGGLRYFDSSDPWTVYFIQAGDDGPIKIGRTQGSPLGRMEALQAGIPVDLRILAIISHVRSSHETDLHRRFAHLHIRGEWFRPEPDLLTYIRENAIPWTLRKDQIPGWWWTGYDKRNREMIEDSMRFPERFQDDELGGFPTYEDYLRWRQSVGRSPASDN